jgi:type I restriction enzyme, S subunit
MSVKHTKIKNLTNDGKSGLFTDGDWVESKDQDPDGGVRLIQLADVGINKFKDKSNRYLTESKASELSCTFLKKGDLLISRLPDPLGRTCMFPLDGDKKYVTVVDVSILRVDEVAYNSKYVEYILNSPQTRQKVQSKQTGTTRKRISRKNLAEIEIPTPPLPTQNRIVEKIEELFSELDNGVENLKKAQKQLKTYRQAVLKDAFEGKLTKEWREQQDDLPTPEELLQQIKAERKAHRQRELTEWEKEVEKWAKKGEKGKKPTKPRKSRSVDELTRDEPFTLHELPENWWWGKINDITHRVEYGTSNKSIGEGEIPVLRMGNMQNGRIDWSDLKYSIDSKDNEEYLLRKEDVLFNRTNSPELVGKAVIYKGERPAIFAGYLIRLNQIREIMNGYYLNYFLNSVTAKKHGNTVKTDGVNQSNINGTKLVNYPIPLCSKKEQDQIVQEIESRLSVIEQLEQTIKENLQKAKALRQSILKKAFSGELVGE